MHKYVPVIAAAALAVGSLVMGQAQQPNDMQPGQQQPKEMKDKASPLDQPMKSDTSVKPDQSAKSDQFKTDTQALPAAGQVGGVADLQRQIPSQAATVKEDSASKRDLQKVIAQITEAAVTEGRYDQIKTSLFKSDQQRMQGGMTGMTGMTGMGGMNDMTGAKTATGDKAVTGDTTKVGGTADRTTTNEPANATVAGGAQTQDLDTAIKDLRRVFKEKYNKDLAISESQVLPQQALVLAGEVTNPQMLTTWPLRATESGRAKLDTSGDMAQPAAGGLDRARDTKDMKTEPKTGGLTQDRMSQDQKSGLKQGDKIAVLQLPADQQLPELTASFVQSQGGKWTLDIPDTMDGAKLRQNLSEHIRYIAQNKDTLPADADKASQAIAHHVLMALYDVDMPMGAGMQPQPGM